jgi:hypothetical protein
MKNYKLQNVLKTIFIFPIVFFIALPLLWIFNDMGIKETWKDLFKDFWRFKK